MALYTSPELVSYTERMEIDGKPISEEFFARGIALAMEAGKRVNSRRRDAGERPYDITEFDLLTVGAVCIFADAQVDVAVLECGMGGRWDATSAVESIEAVAVTGVGLDHMRILGDTLEEIASEKAAVIKSGRACVLGAGTSTPTSVEDVFLNQCAQQGVTPTLVRPYETCDAPGILEKGQARDTRSYPVVRWHNIHMPHRIGDTLIERVETPFALYETVGSLKPAYQAGNIACAIALAEVFLGRALNNEQLEQSIVLCPTPGRFDVVRAEPLVLVDACHNPQSIRAFLSALDAIEPDVARRPALLVAVLPIRTLKVFVSYSQEHFLACMSQLQHLREPCLPINWLKYSKHIRPHLKQFLTTWDVLWTRLPMNRLLRVGRFPWRERLSEHCVNTVFYTSVHVLRSGMQNRVTYLKHFSDMHDRHHVH